MSVVRLTIAGVFLALMAPGASANRETLWGSTEHFTRKGHLRYLLLAPPGYDPHQPCELWVNLHGSPGCASHAIFQYREEAAQHHALLLAPEATEGAGEFYTREDGAKAEYNLFDMKANRRQVLTVLNEGLANYNVN